MRLVRGAEVPYKIASLIEDGVVKEIKLIGGNVSCLVEFKTSQANIDIIREVLYREEGGAHERRTV